MTPMPPLTTTITTLHPDRHDTEHPGETDHLTHTKPTNRYLKEGTFPSMDTDLSFVFFCVFEKLILVRSSARFLNRHLIGPQLTYYHPGRRYYHDYENYTFRSR